MTHRKANITKFPTRETFADAVVNSFTLSGKVTLKHWTCCFADNLGPALSYVCQVTGTYEVQPC